jgi:hypothetical protein
VGRRRRRRSFRRHRLRGRSQKKAIQTTYPNRLLAIEVVNGTLGTLAIIFFLQAVVGTGGAPPPPG